MEQKIIKSNILLPFLEASYREEYTEYARKNLRASDAGAAADEGEKCEREIYYDFTLPEKKSLLSTGSLVLFDDGRLHEADIRRRLRLILRSPERELSDEEIGARGKIDNQVDAHKIKTWEIEKVPVGLDLIGDPILEIKSLNEFQFQEFAAKGIISQAYYDQVQYYLFLSKIKWALILIKNRNSSGAEKGSLPFLEFIILPDEKRQSEIRAGLKTTKECADNKILPPRPFLRESSKCSYCRFKVECWGAEIEKVLETKPDTSIESPSQEILESAVLLYNTTNRQIKDLEKQSDEARAVIERYFKATGKSEILVQNVKASYIISGKTLLDKALLIKELGPIKYADIAEPSRKLIEKAIEDRQIDAGIYDRAKRVIEGFAQLRVIELKATTERIKDIKELPVEVQEKIKKSVTLDIPAAKKRGRPRKVKK